MESVERASKSSGKEEVAISNVNKVPVVCYKTSLTNRLHISIVLNPFFTFKTNTENYPLGIGCQRSERHVNDMITINDHFASENPNDLIMLHKTIYQA